MLYFLVNQYPNQANEIMCNSCNYYLDTLFSAFSRFFNKLLIMPGGTWWDPVGPWGCLVGPGGTSWDTGDAWWDTCGTF